MANRTTGTRIYLSLIGALLLLAGGVFTWLMARSFARAREIDSWPTTEAMVLASSVEQRRIDPARPAEYHFAVRYAYAWQGEELESGRFSLRGSSWTSKKERVEALAEQFPVGSVHEVAVDPDDPRVALLDTESKAPGYSIWFPALIAAGGLGVIVGAWRR